MDSFLLMVRSFMMTLGVSVIIVPVFAAGVSSLLILRLLTPKRTAVRSHVHEVRTALELEAMCRVEAEKGRWAA